MDRFKVFRTLALVAAAVGLAGCSDQSLPTGPASVADPPLQFSRFSAWDDGRQTAIEWQDAPRSVSVTRVIDAGGGTLSIPSADFTITFPAGAVAVPVSITVSTVKGRYVAYDMLPHGITFAATVLVKQGLHNTEVYDDDFNRTLVLHGVYIGSDVMPGIDRKVPVTEILPSAIVFTRVRGKLMPDYLVWQINHLSRYMLASG